jgi:hypothetical protein
MALSDRTAWRSVAAGCTLLVGSLLAPWVLSAVG